MRRSWLLVFGLVAVLAVGLVACVPAATPTAAPTAAPTVAPTPTKAPPPVTPKSGGTLRWAPQASLKAIDPVWTTASVTHNISHLIWEPLFAYNSKYQAKPMVVDTWKASEDLTKFTITIRSGLTFHDGSTVTAEAAALSVQRCHKRWPQCTAVARMVKSIDTVDALTFTITTTQPFGALIDYTAPEPLVMPKALASTPAEEAIKSYIGSGPFKFVLWEPGNRVVLEKFPGYKSRTEPQDGSSGARIVYVDRIENIEVPDPATKVAGLETGQFDFAEGIPGDFYSRLKANPKLQAHTVSPWAAPGVIFNKFNLPFKNVKARLAVQMAYPREDAMRAAYGPQELWQICPAVFFCGTRWATDAGKELWADQDLTKAKALWAEAMKETGYTGPVRILAATDYPDFWAASLVTKATLEKLGATVDHAASDWATVITRRTSQKDIGEGGWSIFHTWNGFASAFDPFLDERLSTTWFGWYDNPKMRELQTAFATSGSEAERKKLVDQMQTMWFQDPPAVVIGNFNFLVVLQSYVKGFVPFTSPVTRMWGLWLDK